jgi:23S rRNA (pseudouridine1915-N3)-methyltransferase
MFRRSFFYLCIRKFTISLIKNRTTNLNFYQHKKTTCVNISLICIGKTSESYLQQGISIYEKRLKNYSAFSLNILPDLKNTRNMPPASICEVEGDVILNNLKPGDDVILLDEKGTEFASVELATFLQKKMNVATRNLVFIIGGPYGFSEKVYQRANNKISLSKMTFSHQMVRLIFVEQLYRAFTILKGEPYHHP